MKQLNNIRNHYDDVIISAIASQITSLTIVYSTVYPGADQSKHESSASLAFVWGIHRGPIQPFTIVVVIITIPEAKKRHFQIRFL